MCNRVYNHPTLAPPPFEEDLLKKIIFLHYGMLGLPVFYPHGWKNAPVVWWGKHGITTQCDNGYFLYDPFRKQ